MRSRPARALPYLLAFVLGLGAAGLAACGEKTNPRMIPAGNAAELLEHLDEVQSAIDSKDCADAARAIGQVRSDLTSLPSGTGQSLQERLEEGVTKLEEQAGEECEETTTAETQTTTTETIPTTPTETVPPETVPPTTTETVPPETVPTTPTETVPPDTGGVEVEK